MIKIVLLKKSLVEDAWPVIKPFLERAADYSNGESSIESIKQECLSGTTTILLTFDGNDIIGVTGIQRIRYLSGMFVLMVQYQAGERIDEWIDQIFELCELTAKYHGCSHIYVAGRPGWERKGKKYGFEKVHVILSKEV